MEDIVWVLLNVPLYRSVLCRMTLHITHDYQHLHGNTCTPVLINDETCPSVGSNQGVQQQNNYKCLT